MSESMSQETSKAKAKASTTAKKKKPRSALKALPYSSGIKELSIEIKAQAMTALEKAAAAQNRSAKYGKIEVSDIVSALAFDMDDGLKIDHVKEKKTAATLTIPAAALALLESCAARSNVSLDRVVEELALTLQGN